MPYFMGRGVMYKRTRAGCYPVNNGDPQCVDDDAPEPEELEPDGYEIADLIDDTTA
jgi:hypothetical protein